VGQRQKLQRNAGTTVATFALISIAGGVSFVLPDSLDLPTLSVPASVDTSPEPSTVRTDGPITEHTTPDTDESDRADTPRRPS